MLFVTHAVLTSKQQAVIKLTSETLQQQKDIWFDAVSPHQCWTPASKIHYKKHEFFKEPWKKEALWLWVANMSRVVFKTVKAFENISQQKRSGLLKSWFAYRETWKKGRKWNKTLHFKLASTDKTSKRILVLDAQSETWFQKISEFRAEMNLQSPDQKVTVKQRIYKALYKHQPENYGANWPWWFAREWPLRLMAVGDQIRKDWEVCLPRASVDEM